MLILLIIAAAIIFLAAGYVPAVRSYEFKSAKIKKPVRFALITDLHSCRYGKNQTRLISLIESLKIDAVLFAGDIIDDKLPEGRAYKLIQALEAKTPCFYVAGNHEYRTRKADEIKRRLKSMGVTVLQGGCADVVLNGQRVLIFGVDDPEFGQNAFETQLGGLKGKDDVYSVLLAHRPEYIDKYLEHNFDLILSGHAHGGQWRLPGLINGLYAPNQGLFPKYAGGLYKFTGTDFIVGRGLARETTPVPRLFNRPEIPVIELKPKF